MVSLRIFERCAVCHRLAFHTAAKYFHCQPCRVTAGEYEICWKKIPVQKVEKLKVNMLKTEYLNWHVIKTNVGSEHSYRKQTQSVCEKKCLDVFFPLPLLQITPFPS